MNFKKIATICLGFLGLTGLGSAQNSSQNISVIQGEAATYYSLTCFGVAREVCMSPDGRYLGAAVTNNDIGFVYDRQEDRVKQTIAVSVISSWDRYAGGNFIYVNGDTIPIESWYDGSEEENITVYGASRSLDTIITMAHEYITMPFSGQKARINYPYIVDGKTGKILERVKPHWPMRSDLQSQNEGRVNMASADAKILVGHGHRPGGAPWAPVFWDVEHDTSFFVGDFENIEDGDYGDLQSVSSDGTIIGGRAFAQKGVLVFYDRENQTYTVEYLPYAPGNRFMNVAAITNSGLVLTLQSTQGSDLNRVPYLYNIHDKSLVDFDEYLRELYGLNHGAQNPYIMSDDGRRIMGWTWYGAPYLIELGEHQILAKPRNLAASQVYGEMKVRLAWTAPMKGEYSLLGYNVYCDGKKLNEEMIDKSQTTFEHNENVADGIHIYTVTSVYAGETEEDEARESKPCSGRRILVISDKSCLPVQQMGFNVTFNRDVEIYWSLPSSEMVDLPDEEETTDAVRATSPVSGGEGVGHAFPVSKSYTDESLDLISYQKVAGLYSAVLRIDDLLYTASYAGGVLTVRNPNDMSVVKSLEVPTLSMITNMVQVGDRLYLATGKGKIVTIDLKTFTVATELTMKNVVRHISYIPSLNNGKGGFAYGDWKTLFYCDLYGRELTTGVPDIDIDGLIISGTAYNQKDNKFYIFSQTGEPCYAEIYTVNFENGQYLSRRNLGEIQRLLYIEPYNGFLGGGMSLNTLPDGTTALAAILQFPAASTHLAYLEVESAPYLLGYNLYRSKDGGEPVKLNKDGEYIKRLSYAEQLVEPGQYTYQVEAVSDIEGMEVPCENMLPHVKTMVTINPVGTCSAPKELKLVEQLHSVRLDWNYTRAAEDPGLVSFRIYRDGEILEDYYTDVKYIDRDVEKGDHAYRVEAFYNNSCTASDSAKIKVTYEGVMMPPAHLALQEKAVEDQKYDVSVSWDVPYFETPIGIGYCGQPYWGTSFSNGKPVYALVGWDTAGLAPYKDLYVVGIEYYIGENVTNVDGLVYLNDTFAYQCPSTARIKENAWNTLIFGRYIPMDQPQELLVGYKVSYRLNTESTDGTHVAYFDKGPGKAWYSDLVSNDGQQWFSFAQSYQVEMNWCINALVVNKRDLEEATAAASAGLGQSGMPMVKVMSLDMATMEITEPKALAHTPKLSSETIKLNGFNLYRDGEKINENLLSGFAYQDQALSAGSYEYQVSAVYNNGEEVESEPCFLDLGNVDNEMDKLSDRLHVYPNPARDFFRVEGDYTSLEIMTTSGTVLRRYKDGVSEINVNGLSAGLYILRFTLTDGAVYQQKLVLE